MATGTVTVFDDAREYMFDGGWASGDSISLAILDNTTAPLVADVAPIVADYNQVTGAGSYSIWVLDTWGTMVSQTAGVMKFDSADIPTWPADALNDVDAYWAYIYNSTQAGGPGIAFIELGGPVDMQAIPLTITFANAGIFTI